MNLAHSPTYLTRWRCAAPSQLPKSSENTGCWLIPADLHQPKQLNTRVPWGQPISAPHPPSWFENLLRHSLAFLSLSLALLVHVNPHRNKALPPPFLSLLTYMHNELSTSYLPRPLQTFPFFPGFPGIFRVAREEKNGLRLLPLAFTLSSSTFPLP